MILSFAAVLRWMFLMRDHDVIVAYCTESEIECQQFLCSVTYIKTHYP